MKIPESRELILLLLLLKVRLLERCLDLMELPIQMELEKTIVSEVKELRQLIIAIMGLKGELESMTKQEMKDLNRKYQEIQGWLSENQCRECNERFLNFLKPTVIVV